MKRPSRYDREHAWKAKRRGQQKRILVHVHSRSVCVAWDDESCDRPKAIGYVTTTRDAQEGVVGFAYKGHDLFLSDRNGRMRRVVPSFISGLWLCLENGEPISFEVLS